MKKEDYLTRDYIKTSNAYFYHSLSHKHNTDFELHCHNFYEIFFLFSGDVDYFVEGREYTPAPGSMLLIAPNVFHGVRVNSYQLYHRFAVHFSADLLPKSSHVLLDGFHGTNIYYPHIDGYNIPKYSKSVLECKDFSPSLLEVALASRVVSLICEIYQMSHNNKGAAPTGDKRIDDIILHINQNLSCQLTLNQIAEKFFISPNHLNVIFARSTGTTISNYIKIKRLTQARQKILNGVPSGRAALDVGFGDYSNFYRSYKTYFGHSPSKVSDISLYMNSDR